MESEKTQLCNNTITHDAKDAVARKPSFEQKKMTTYKKWYLA